MIDKLKQIKKSWWFLIAIILIYTGFFIFNSEIFFSSFNFFMNIITKIIPILILIFILMTITNYFVSPEFVAKHLKDKGIKKWIFIIVGGLLSTGPIYMWYPWLADLRKKGLSNGSVAAFLYNRGIKLPILPLAILYFGWQYIFVLVVVMVFASIIQCIFIDRFMDVI